MGIAFPSKEWTVAYKEAINNNEAYKIAGKPWVFGRVGMVIKAEPSKNIPEDVGMILDVHEGVCRDAKYVTDRNEINECAFVIVATFDRWKSVIHKELDPIRAMMEGKLKLEKGNLPTMIRFVESSRQLVNSASLVPTDFPNE